MPDLVTMRGLAALRSISLSQLLKPQTTHVIRPALLISSRGVASKLFVGGLSFYTTEKVLSEAFSQFGQLIEAKIITDKVSVRSKGFGFVTFASEDEAEKALTEMNGKVLNGRVIFVEYAKARARFDDVGPPIARGSPAKPPSQD
ncbi:small RNA-binding protein 11, chloroplastic-like isoform X1 [Aristolochia californica]|uniref:small RNA-binding protein 11, chloroplastic-like isoform X1 n=1 Tax=Aristolochia californica TaxID=171875 RepID=UPI0035DDEDF2